MEICSYTLFEWKGIKVRDQLDLAWQMGTMNNLLWTVDHRNEVPSFHVPPLATPKYINMSDKKCLTNDSLRYTYIYILCILHTVYLRWIRTAWSPASGSRISRNFFFFVSEELLFGEQEIEGPYIRTARSPTKSLYCKISLIYWSTCLLRFVWTLCSNTNTYLHW